MTRDRRHIRLMHTLNAIIFKVLWFLDIRTFPLIHKHKIHTLKHTRWEFMVSSVPWQMKNKKKQSNSLGSGAAYGETKKKKNENNNSRNRNASSFYVSAIFGRKVKVLN